MFCTKCGAQNNEGVSFCQSCGQALGNAEISTSNSPQYETISISVGPEGENKSIQLYELFGWEFYSTQTIDNKDSHLERHGDTVWNVTEHTNYVKLAFRRNKNMPRYEDFVRLENEYWENEDKDLGMSQYILGFGACILGGIIPIFFPLFIIGIIIIIKRRKAGEKVAQENFERYKKQEEIKEKARRLWIEIM